MPTVNTYSRCDRPEWSFCPGLTAFGVRCSLGSAGTGIPFLRRRQAWSIEPLDRLHVVITMDVEPPTPDTHPTATGPENCANSEKFIRGYVERAAEFGFPVTFFIHPGVAVEQADLFEELKGRGGCVEGLHLHPWKFRDGKYRAHFGGLGERDLRAVLLESISMWRSGMGRRPLYFRPGTFSANDHMYQVLADLGFRGGSCSVPGRIWPRMNAVWTGAAPDPHRAHPVFHQNVGSLPFANMPERRRDSLRRCGASGADAWPSGLGWRLSRARASYRCDGADGGPSIRERPGLDRA